MQRGLLRRLLVTNKAILFTLVLGVTFWRLSPYFLTSTNLFNLLQQISVMALVALGFTFVLGAAEIDLSIGGIVGLVGVIMAKLMTEAGLPWYLAVACGLVAGGFCGAFNATLISQFDLPPFIVTLATNSLFTGLLYILTNLIPISNLPSTFVSIGMGYAGPVPVPVFVVLPAIGLAYIMAKRSVFGRYVVALGANVEAVRIAGVSVKRVRLGVYVVSGLACAAASVVLTALSASAQTSAGANLLLDVIAAVVIGGTPLFGGKMDIVGTVFGCLIIGMINDGLNILGVNANYQIISEGAVILLALAMDVESTKVLLRLSKSQVLRANRLTESGLREKGLT